MPTEPLNAARVRRFLDLAATRLEGEWLLVGGGLAALWLLPDRTTEDIDLIGLQGTAEERFALMELALEDGLTIEAVNSAADFFVQRIDGWRDRIEPFIQGRACTIYRPDPTLFVLLKVARLSERDAGDVNAVLDRVARGDLAVDPDRIRAHVAALPTSPDTAVVARRAAVVERLAPPAQNRKPTPTMP